LWRGLDFDVFEEFERPTRLMPEFRDYKNTMALTAIENRGAKTPTELTAGGRAGDGEDDEVEDEREEEEGDWKTTS